MKHDASRVVQSVVKHGTPAQRTMVLSELKGKIQVLSRSKHGHFLVCKLLRYLKGKELDEVLKEFRGNCVRMGTHSTAAVRGRRPPDGPPALTRALPAPPSSFSSTRTTAS